MRASSGQTARRRRRQVGWLAAGLTLFTASTLALPGGAVLLGSGDGARNTSPPLDDPGIAQLGRWSGLGKLYVGNGWILTARHVGATDVNFGGVVYPWIVGSRVNFANPAPTGDDPDLIAYQLEGPDWPDFPMLEIATVTPAVGTEATLVGQGRNRGDATTWNAGGGTFIDGWEWDATRNRRWGTNLIGQVGVDVQIDNTLTRALIMDFSEPSDPNALPDESQVTTGDSGGSLFVKENGEWVLAGILFARSSYGGQPDETALFGNETLAVDLSHYWDQIIATVRPECSNETDDDGDLAVDYPADPECESAADFSEGPDCGDGIDNDWDGATDYPDDSGCIDGASLIEDPQCSDGVDNDFDSLIDWDGAGGSPDPQCIGMPWKNRESRTGRCGLGFELAFALPLLALRRARRRRDRAEH